MIKYDVIGMGCAGCVKRVENAVNNIDGVVKAEVSLLTNSMTIEGDVEPSIIIEAVKKAGFNAALAREEIEKQYEDKTTPVLKKRFFISLGVLLVLVYISMGHTMWGWPIGVLEGKVTHVAFFQMILALALCVINKDFFVKGIAGFIHKAPNMDSLVCVGAGLSFIYSVYVYIQMLCGNMELNLYFETCGMILTLITLGKMLESKAKGKTTNAIKGLIELSPKTADVEKNGEVVNVDIASIKVGDIVIVKEGNHFPVDGVVIEGSGFADESSLTGESVLVMKDCDTEVYTSTTLMKGTIKVKATRVGADTSLAKIIDSVNNANATKAPIAQMADKVAGVFVPVVMGLALITFIIWICVGSGAEYALARAIAVLVISCPCAMGLATPVAIMVGSGVGAGSGLLFKSAESLEMTGKAQIVVLDKTGTVTEGKLSACEATEDGPAAFEGVKLDTCVKDETTAFEGIKLDTGADRIKKDSRQAVEKLKAMGLRVIMLTGDNKETALRIANEAGIDEVISEVLPDSKGDTIDRLKSEGKVLMVGDGINDAVALTKADVGMAIGSGKDIAIDSADVVLADGSLMGVVRAIELGKLTLRKIKQNLFWAFFYNIIGIPLAAGVFVYAFNIALPPMYGAACMSLSSFIVVMNALTINRFGKQQ